MTYHEADVDELAKVLMELAPGAMGLDGARPMARHILDAGYSRPKVTVLGGILPVEFVKARLDEAEAATTVSGNVFPLKRITAMRRVVVMWETQHRIAAENPWAAPAEWLLSDVICALATEWEDHPQFDRGWME